MTDQDKQDAKVWAYVLGEGSRQERAEMEQQMAQDPLLAEQVAAAKKIDRVMDRLIPAMNQTQEQVAEDIVRDWERQLASQQQQGEDTVLERAPSTPSFWAWLSSGLLPRLALAAACLLLAFSFITRMSGPLRWVDPGESAIVRGDLPPGMSAEDYRALEKSVRNALIAAYRRDVPDTEQSWLAGAKSPWLWRVRVAPTADAAILVQVALVNRKSGEPRQEWAEVFADTHDFTDRITPWTSGVMDTYRTDHATRR